ncbi:MAG: 2-C-methyl-D-erythritol 4-phosphate cytidylyltransferase [Verrucomicrobiae bacterium]|nr:2-C-methyl-D-erythritol 4-phosphate cytidylyltransferase [Verrucomicrobiae bacterium]
MNTAIIVAAGRGTRMGSGVEKLFLELAGKPVIAHTWRRFEEAACVDEIVLVVRPESRETFREVAEREGFGKPYRWADGGAERQDSVWNGIQQVAAGSAVVAIHDGARPCVREDVIEAAIEAARIHGAAVVANKLTDTVKESDDGEVVSRHMDRNRLWAVSTPQTFRVEVIRRALEAARKQDRVFTDDTAACQLIGQAVRLVPTTRPNPKVTTPDDLPAVESLLRTMEATADRPRR